MDSISLTNLSSAITRDAIKQAELALEGNPILFCISSEDDAVYVFKSAKTSLLNSFDIRIIKSKLSKQTGDVSTEELACFIHYLKYHKLSELKTDKPKPKRLTAVTNQKDQIKDTKSASKKGAVNSVAEIFLYSRTGFPNASSVWEKWLINAKILFKGKEYVGNSNKLRQIRFEYDGVSHDLTVQDFDSQSRQVIRFITQYAEPDGNGFSFKSDLAAEFFHCLIGFKNLSYNDQKIIIHNEKARITAIPCGDSSGFYKAALFIGNRTLPLSNPLTVIGKSGLWVGEKGEYWWIDAMCDLVWLRAFILSEKHSLESIKNHIDISPDSKETTALVLEHKCQVQYNLDYFPGSKNGLAVSLAFKYGEFTFDESDTKIEAVGNSYVKRDKEFEQNAIDKLLSYGLTRSINEHGKTCFCLSDSEGIGLFVEHNIITLLSLKGGHILLTPSASKLISSDLNEIEISISSVTQERDAVKGKFRLFSSSYLFKWKELVRLARENRSFIIKDGRIFKLSQKLGDFLDKADEIALINGNELSIAINSVIYWVDLAKEIENAVPEEWHNLSVSILSAPAEKKDVLNLANFNGTLRDYQLEAVKWMRKMISNSCNTILADEMGLGKTIQTLALIQSMIHENPASTPILIVCPTSLVHNWEAEAKKFTPSLKMLLVGGGDREQLISVLSKYTIVITSYAVIKRDIELYKDIEFELLVLDEAQHIKNSDTLNARVCKQINARHKLVLTGTPLENSPEDIWSIFDFLNSGTLGSKEAFRHHYFKIENDREKQNELSARIQPFILRRKKIDVEQLPEKTEQILYCEMSEGQRKVYNDILYKGRLECDSFLQGKSTRFNVLSSLLRLRQLCCHPKLLPDFTNQGNIESAKTELLHELIWEIIDSEHRTLVFSQFTSLLSIIKNWCKEQKIPFEYLDGNTKDRMERVNHFNKNKHIDLFLLSLKAGGVGLNLTGADTVIIYDPWWNPSVEAQATDRTHRIGQKNPITTIKLVVKDSIEEKILELQKRKQNLFNGIVESSSSFSRLSDKDIEYLLN
ncbi:MAG: DEAD/DEAH box helicase [Lentisphaerota bacterium]